MKLQLKAEALVSDDEGKPVLEYSIDATVHSFEALFEQILSAGLALDAALSGKTKAVADKAIAKAAK